MTDYREITSPEVEPRAPVTTALMSALRDNPISIANGDETVPNEARVKNSAFSILAPGDVEVLRASKEAFTNLVNTDTELFRMPFHQSGEVTFSFRYKTSGDAVEGRFRVRRIRAGSNCKTRDRPIRLRGENSPTWPNSILCRAFCSGSYQSVSALC